MAPPGPSTSSPTPPSTRRCWAAGWTTRDCPGPASPVTTRFITGGASNELFEVVRGDLPGGAAPAARPGAGRPGQDHAARVPAAGRPGRHRRPPRPAGGGLRRPVGAGGLLLPDGVRRRLVAHPGGHHLARPVRRRPRRPAGPGLPAGRRHRPAVPGGLGGEGPRRLRPPRGVPRAPGRPVAAPTWRPCSSGRSRASTRPPPGCGRTGPPPTVPGIMHGDYQFANVMYRHGAPARLAAIVDWEMATVGDPLLDLGWVINGWPDDTSAAGEGTGQLRRLHRHAVEGRAAGVLPARPAAARSTRSTTT